MAALKQHEKEGEAEVLFTSPREAQNRRHTQAGATAMWAPPHPVAWSAAPPGVPPQCCASSGAHKLFQTQPTHHTPATIQHFFFDPKPIWPYSWSYPALERLLTNRPTTNKQKPLQIPSVTHSFCSLWPSLTHHRATAHFDSCNPFNYKIRVQATSSFSSSKENLLI